MYKICMVGTGYVGLVSGACFADFGNTVICVEPSELVATIYHSLGLDLETKLPGPAGRPFTLVDSGKHEIHELF